MCFVRDNPPASMPVPNGTGLTNWQKRFDAQVPVFILFFRDLRYGNKISREENRFGSRL